MTTKENFNFIFDESACGGCGGACCTGESGFIWINEAEITALASLLKISKNEPKKFIEKVRKTTTFNGKMVAFYGASDLTRTGDLLITSAR